MYLPRKYTSTPVIEQRKQGWLLTQGLIKLSDKKEK